MKYIFPFLICALFGSCFNEGDCLITATNLMHIQFKKKSNISLDTFVNFAPQSIFFSGTDSVASITVATNELLLPVDIDPSTNATTFYFHRVNPYDSTVLITDTLEVEYSKQTKVISKDCGAYTFYSNLKILNTNLKSLKVLSTSLIKDPTAGSTAPSSYAINYQIYY